MRRTALLFLAVSLVLGGCSSKKGKSKLQMRLEREAKMLAAMKEKGPRPKLKVTPEKFASLLRQAFGDQKFKLVDPKGRFFESPKARWRRYLRFDASTPAFDKNAGVLYGASKDGRRVVALNVRTGKILWRSPPVLRKIKVEKKKKKQTNEDTKQLDALFELNGDRIVVAQNRRKGTEIVVHVVALDTRNGRVKWKRKVTNPWTDVFALWSHGRVIFLGDSSSGPIYTFTADKGKQFKINYPVGETFVWGDSDGKVVVFYHGRRSGELYVVGHRTDGSVIYRTPLPGCYTHKMYYQPMIRGVLACKAKSTVKKHVDRVLKIRYADGKVLWKVDAHVRPVDTLRDKQRPDLISLRKGTNGAVLFRNRFGLVRIEKDGTKKWTYPLDDKEIMVVSGGRKYRSDNVLGGDGPYRKIVNLDPGTGKVLWEYTEPTGLPAHVRLRYGKVAMTGDTRVRILSLKTGKLLYSTDTTLRLEGATVVGNLVHVDTAGVRRTYRISDKKLLLYDRSEDETVLNQWLKIPDIAGLLLLHDKDHQIVRYEPVEKSRLRPIPMDKVRTASVLTPATVEVDTVRWVDNDTLEFSSPDDKRAWRISTKGGAIKDAGEAILDAKYGKGGVAMLADPTKVTERFSLKLIQDGKNKVITHRPVGQFAWSPRSHKLVYADHRKLSVESALDGARDLVVQIYDAKRDKRKEIMLLKGASKRTSLVSASFGPGDRTVTIVLENLMGNHFVGTIPTSRKTVATMKVSAGEVDVQIPTHRAPTRGLGFAEGEAFGEVAWSPNGSYLAYNRGGRLQLLSRSGKEQFDPQESTVSNMVWAPNGRSLVYVRDGNLWLYRGGKRIQLSYMLPKREPRSEEETRHGNWRRISPVAFSPDSKRIAFGLRWPKRANMRLMVLEL